MKTSTIILLIVASSLVVLGLLVIAGAMVVNNWRLTDMGKKYEPKTFEITEDFSNISINTDTADITFMVSDSDSCKVVCYAEQKLNHSVKASGGALSIDLVDTRKWYDHINLFSFGQSAITVYLPKTEYAGLSIKNSTGDVNISKDFSFESIDVRVSTGDVKNYASVSGGAYIKTSTGHISVENISAGAMYLSVTTGHINVSSVNCEGEIDITVSTGKTRLSDVKCASLLSTGSTGDIFMSKVVATGDFSIERSTGDVTFESCDATNITVVTDTGEVEGSLLSDKVFIVRTDTGDIDVPRTTTGGKCEITTDTGDVEITVNK